MDEDEHPTREEAARFWWRVAIIFGFVTGALIDLVIAATHNGLFWH